MCKVDFIVYEEQLITALFYWKHRLSFFMMFYSEISKIYTK